MDLSTLIVSYRSRDALLECLASLRDAAPGLETETVVIDNDSRDDVAAAVAREFPAARLIENQENVGYARAVNQGIRASSGRYVLVMNPDCELRPAAARRLADYLESHPRSAIAAPRILNPDGSLEYSARSFPDHFTFLFNRYSLLSRLLPGNPWTRRYLLSDWDHASVRDVDWVSGACMVVRRAAIDEVGGMDEAFFMFNEDVDWCRRMKLGGWAVSYVPDAVCMHHIGASRRTSARVILARHRGMVHYFHKHHPVAPPLSWLVDLMILTRGWLMIAANAFRA
ncbi:MAG TPA: glycosyltransferase family 2 protein [Candidatus Udaeobacter sp.]|jgi:GT2 family glycosyltransferase|nr:glycosyltransferase family 2 protein [Candidatus Udaeobacter sp.]